VDIRILGAHSSELRGSRLASLLIDDTLLIDAGGVTSALSLPEQREISTVLLTHHHFDHTRDLITLAANAANYWQGQLVVCGLPHTLDIVTRYLLDGVLYINFLEHPSKLRPTVILEPIDPTTTKCIRDLQILALAVKHSVPAVGYQVTSPGGVSMFYTGDSSGELSECWQHISPQLIITEISGPDDRADWLKSVGHLCPASLKEELQEFHRLKGYVPRVVVVHIGNSSEREIENEITRIADDLGADISLGCEDMRLTL